MADESPLNEKCNTRELRQEERALIEALLEHSGILTSYVKSLDDARVFDMQDGGMGSIGFEPYSSRRYGRTIAEAQYTDIDGVLVSITINADKDGNLYELDSWKVDFNPLKRYPKPCELEFKKFGS
jgi:endo-1,4-beta-mannosidase